MNTGYVYKLCCTDITVPEIYVGSTKSLRNRKAGHKTKCNGYNVQPKLYDYINANGGWDNWTMVTLETLKYNEKHELRARERFWIEQLQATLNAVIPNRTDSEYGIVYRQTHAEEIKQKKHDDHILNREANLARMKQYQATHLESIKLRHQKYRTENAVILSARKKERVVCECGINVARHYLTDHRQTPKHTKLLAAKNISPSDIVPTEPESEHATNNSPPPIQLS